MNPIVERLKNGNHILSAEGVFLFDGENIYNK